MTEPMEAAQYYRYQPPEGLVMGEPEVGDGARDDNQRSELDGEDV